MGAAELRAHVFANITHEMINVRQSSKPPYRVRTDVLGAITTWLCDSVTCSPPPTTKLHTLSTFTGRADSQIVTHALAFAAGGAATLAAVAAALLLRGRRRRSGQKPIAVMVAVDATPLRALP
eukprot:210403-Prymnesium_polylepis.1